MAIIINVNGLANAVINESGTSAGGGQWPQSAASISISMDVIMKA
jgi:hypothetical protein